MYRLFGVGKIPESIATALEAEGVLLLDEGLRGSVTYRGFRAPGKMFRWKREWYVGSIILTEVRLVGLGYSSTIIDVPLTDPRLRRMQFSVKRNDVLLVAFDAALFHDDWSGSVEYRFRTPQAHDFVKRLGVSRLTGRYSVGKSFRIPWRWIICDRCGFRVCPKCLNTHKGKYGSGFKCSRCAFGHMRNKQ